MAIAHIAFSHCAALSIVLLLDDLRHRASAMTGRARHPLKLRTILIFGVHIHAGPRHGDIEAQWMNATVPMAEHIALAIAVVAFADVSH
jgi:hypothetical protein